jgi:hypothetical protein
MLTDGDRHWLETKFTNLHAEINKQGSKVYHLESAIELLKAGSPHKCAEEIQKHEDSSWSHNPKKAIGLGASIVAALEGIRAMFHK